MKVQKTVLFIVIGLVMLNNVEHLAWVHYTIANKLLPVVGEFDWLNKVHSIVVVVIFEVVVITFAVQGQKSFSLFFTFCIWIISMIYYDTAGLIEASHWQEAISATVYSTIFTISIYMFSEMLAEWYQDERMVDVLTKRINDLNDEINKWKIKCNAFEASYNDLNAQNIDYQEDLTQANAELKSLTSRLKNFEDAEARAKSELLCPFCKEYQADSPAQLRSHKGHCPDKPSKQ